MSAARSLRTRRRAEAAPLVDEVRIDPESPERFVTVLEVGDYEQLVRTAELARMLLGGRTIWNITSTARGGGVAEILTAMLPLAAGVGLDVRWLVIRAQEEFFRLTKRIHNRLHGSAGDGGELGPDERALYDDVLAERARAFVPRLAPEDIVVLHDPQTAGMAPEVARSGATVIWRCHIGVDLPNAIVRSACRFLTPYLERADGYVFSRAEHVWDGLDRRRVAIIPPSIDVFSPKNQHLAPAQVRGILAATGLVEGPREDARFVRVDGSMGGVSRETELSGGPPVPNGVPVVTQISRWDRLKDPLGVVRGFAEQVVPYSDAHLVVAGPAVHAVSDDPEQFETLAEVRALCATLAAETRRRIHLACLPMEDIEENAAIVNALQRLAAVVLQKSLVEGFGLTVAEAMWKERPIVASRVGGIRDQLTDGVNGVLVDPTDLGAYARGVVSLLGDPNLASRLAQAAHRRCYEEYLGPKHLARYVALLERLLVEKQAA